MKIEVVKKKNDGTLAETWSFEITKEMIIELVHLVEAAQDEVNKIEKKKQEEGHPNYAI